MKKLENDKNEFESRKNIWLAISEFYLDTELSEEDIIRITSVLKKTNLELKTLKEIDLFEIFPVLQPNLLSPAGVWIRFDENWLFTGCENCYNKRTNKKYRLKCKIYNYFHYWMRKQHWLAVEKLFNNNI